MKVEARVQSNIDRYFAEEMQRGQRAVKLAMGSAAADLKLAWRRQIADAGLGRRLANSIRFGTYPKGKDSFNAASLVWTKAPKLIDVFNRGVTVQGKNGQWLAVPTKAAGRGDGLKRITPARWEARTGRRLRFVYRRGRSGLLVDDGQRVKGGLGFKGRLPRGAQRQTVVVFVLVRQARLPKKLDLDRDADRIGASLPGRIFAEWKDT